MVASYTQLLQRRYQGQLDAQADTYIGFAVDGAQRMQTLINDLLALSRVGTQGKPFEPTDVGAVVRRALRWLARRARGERRRGRRRRAADRAAATRGSSSSCSRTSSRTRSSSAAPTSPPRVSVTAERRDGVDGGEWLFAVRDNGIGIEPQFAEQIFVIFQRLHTRTEYAGTGIGLAICKKIVERHGGRIWVESETGEGATFFFTLPASPPDDSSIPPPERGARSEERGAS